MLITDILDEAANAFPKRIAVRYGGEALSYVQLRDRSYRLAAALRERGLEPGDRVLEAVPNSLPSIEVDFALARAGLVRVPLNLRLDNTSWQLIASDCKAAAIICSPELRSRAALLEGPSVLTYSRQGEIDGSLLSSRHAQLTSTLRSPLRSGDLHPDEDVIALAYSSGTTGVPKGALRTHRMRVASARAMIRSVMPKEDAAEPVTFLHAGPIIHTSGLFVLPTIKCGGTQVLLTHPTPEEIARGVEEHGATHLAVVPTVLNALADLPDSLHLFRSVRMLGYAGAPMPPSQIRRAFQRVTSNLVQYYGLVEAMPPVSVLSAFDHRAALQASASTGEASSVLESAGCVVPGIEARTGPDSELFLRGAAVTPGYWRAEARQDLAKSVTDGWLATGDIATLSEEGRLTLSDRKDDLIITGGYNVYPGEIESVVDRVSAVSVSVAFGIPDERWGQRIAVAVVPLPGQSVAESEVIAACDLLPGYKHPRSVFIVSELPTGATGKIDRRQVAVQIGGRGR